MTQGTVHAVIDSASDTTATRQPSRRMTGTDALAEVIRGAVRDAVREALNIDEATNRRLLAAEEAATYLSLSKREVYNMIAAGQLLAVSHGRRKMLDIRDLDTWIAENKH
jgi:excisionase family DNA binding protein